MAASMRSGLDLAEPWLYRLFALALLAALYPFVALVFYAHPSADDFCYATVFRSGSFWAGVIGDYLGWKGRYTAIFVTALFHRSGDMTVLYHWPLLLMMALLLVSLYVFTRTLFESGGSRASAVLAALALAVYYMATMPKPAAALYWADGAFQYQVGGIFGLLSAAALLKLCRGRRTLLFSALSCVLVFTGVGASEIIMVALSGTVGLMFLQRVCVARQDRGPWVAVLLVTALSCALVVFSPGNEVRLALQPPERQQIWFSISRALFYGTATMTDWLREPGLWLLTVFFVPLVLRLTYLKRVRQEASWMRFGFILLLVASQVWVSFFVTWWGSATSPAARTLNTVYLVFLAGWLVALLELVAVLVRHRPLAYTPVLFPLPLRIGVFMLPALLAWAMLATSHIIPAYDDLLHRAAEFDRVMKGRYEYIRQLRAAWQGGGGPDATVESLKDPPRTLVFTDISSEQNDWRNSCFSQYFGLSKVTTGAR